MASVLEYARQLQTLAGTTGDSLWLVFRRVEVKATYHPGSAAHLVITTPYVGRNDADGAGYRGRPPLSAPRPMAIQLRKETAGDLRGKRRGVAVETQLGDPVFDEAVYIDSTSRPEVIQRVLGAAPARAAIQALLAGGAGPITLDAKGGTIAVRVEGIGDLPDGVTWLLDHLLTIAAHMPVVHESGEAPPRDAWTGRRNVLAVSGMLGMFPAVLLMFSALPSRCYWSDGEGTQLLCEEAGCCTPVQGGLAAGVLLGAIVATALFRKVRGASNSHTLRPTVAFFAFILVIELCVSVAHLVVPVE